MRLRYSRGFSLLEVLVAAGIATLIALLCATTAKSILSTFTHASARFRGAETLTRLSSLWYAEQDDAWAIFTPPSDLNGKSNSDGHEVDFYTRDESATDRFWAYSFDATAHTLTRYIYTAPGASPSVDQSFTGIASFTAHTYPLTALQDSSSPIYSPVYTNATLHNGSVRFFAATAPWIAGGNQITDVRIANDTQSLEFHLSTQSAPSGYTVVLNYTPAPSPSASPGIMIWPPAIRFAAQGSGTLASTTQTQPTIAETLNALFGGGIARAASACTAEAFNTDVSGNLTTQLPAGSTPPPQWYSGSSQVPPTVDVDGCYNSAAYVVYENRSNVVFKDNSYASTCAAYLSPVSWNPTNAAGPLATRSFVSGPGTTDGCSLMFQDDTSKQVNAYAQIILPCWAVGGTCTYWISYAPDGSPGCDPSTGEISSGYTGGGHAAISPPDAGSWTTNDHGDSYTFTRSKTGSVSVIVYSTYQTWSAAPQRPGIYRCTATMRESQTSSFLIPST